MRFILQQIWSCSGCQNPMPTKEDVWICDFCFCRNCQANSHERESTLYMWSTRTGETLSRKGLVQDCWQVKFDLSRLWYCRFPHRFCFHHGIEFLVLPLKTLKIEISTTNKGRKKGNMVKGIVCFGIKSKTIIGVLEFRQKANARNTIF